MKNILYILIVGSFFIGCGNVDTGKESSSYDISSYKSIVLVKNINSLITNITRDAIIQQSAEQNIILKNISYSSKASCIGFGFTYVSSSIDPSTGFKVSGYSKLENKLLRSCVELDASSAGGVTSGSGGFMLVEEI